MKVLIVNMSDARGGAAIVTYRLLQALNRQSGIEAKMVVADKQTDDPNVIALPRRWWWKKLLDRMVVWTANGFSRKNLWLTDGGFFGNDITHLATFQEADVIHLHWVNQGMLSLQDIRKVLDSGKRIVWTMHDMWPSTSICHHAGSCQRFVAEQCHHCPQLRFPSRHDLAALRWERKKSLFAHSRVQIIACSSWMATYAQSSRITRHLPVTVIPNAFDCPPLQVSKETSQTVKTICFAAARIDTELKGFDDLLQALSHLRHRTDLELVLIGGLNDQRILQQIPIPYRYLGYQKDMLSIYASAGCVVSCSRYETLPTTLVEAQAVGTTPVAYRHSGALDLITDGVTGYFAEYRDTRSLANAIERAIDHPLPPAALHDHVAQTYNGGRIAQKHLEIYKLP